ncbi:MAG: hypothetical protein A2X94_11115 [Bdellovibrionales bacterium GWB1_55_8]|nr:MAG: hypothetical protein A2X94_11115 [Bdellovibrionales bacterium GWB1_55_8]
MTVSRRIWADESGQATTEYILMVALAVTLALMVIREFIKPVLERMTSSLVEKMERGFFGNLHHFPLRR